MICIENIENTTCAVVVQNLKYLKVLRMCIHMQDKLLKIVLICNKIDLVMQYKQIENWKLNTYVKIMNEMMNRRALARHILCVYRLALFVTHANRG